MDWSETESTIEAVTNALLLGPNQAKRVRAMLRGKQEWRGKYFTHDILEACREVEREDGRMYATADNWVPTEERHQKRKRVA